MHCNSSDKGQEAALWKSMREKAKKGIVPFYPSAPFAADDDDSYDSDDDLAREWFFQMERDFPFPFRDESSNEYDSAYDQPKFNNPFARHGHEFLRPGPFEPDKVKINTELASKLTQVRFFGFLYLYLCNRMDR